MKSTCGRDFKLPPFKYSLRITWWWQPEEVTKKKKCKKAKELSEEVLQIAEKGREVKGKGERERYTQLNAEFQRMARKAYLNEQCKEIEGNNRMEKNKDLLKKSGDIKGTFHASMGMIKDRNCKDLKEVEEIKKKWQEYTEELNQKDLMTQITTKVWSLT